MTGSVHFLVFFYEKKNKQFWISIWICYPFPGDSEDPGLKDNSGGTQSLPPPSKLEDNTPRPTPVPSGSHDPNSPGYIVIPDTDGDGGDGVQSAASRADDQQGMYVFQFSNRISDRMSDPRSLIKLKIKYMNGKPVD